MRWQVKERMKFISNRLEKTGYISRQDISKKFGVSLTQGSVDIRKFAVNNPGMIRYNACKKHHVRMP